MKLTTKITKMSLPDKKTVNFATVGIKRMNMLLVIIGVIAVMLVAGLFAKFAIIDRFENMAQAQLEANEIKKQTEDALKKIAEYESLSDEYARYTLTGMTNEELQRVDRNSVIEMINRVVVPDFLLNSWSVSENILTITVTGSTLREINGLTQRLIDEPIVSRGFVTVARTSDKTKSGDDEKVDGTITIYLLKSTETASAAKEKSN